MTSTTIINQDGVFLLRLKPLHKVEFQSGDLIEIIAPGSTRARPYSIAQYNGEILLSIKKYNLGVCSSYLHSLLVHDVIKASIKENLSFHLKKDISDALFIGNGTGIAPFLGMLSNKTKEQAMHLFWGGRTQQSIEIYNPFINKSLEHLNIATSQEGKREYVQDILLEHYLIVTTVLSNGGQILVCGSMEMQKEVFKVLETICLKELQQSLFVYEVQGQILMDCY